MFESVSSVKEVGSGMTGIENEVSVCSSVVNDWAQVQILTLSSFGIFFGFHVN